VTPQEWRALGVFGAALIALTFVDARLAWWFLAAFAAVVVIRNAGRIADLATRVQG
jgi:hypothetical protein